MKEKIYVALTFDTDCDPHPDEQGTTDSLGWSGLENGVPAILEETATCSSKFGIPIPMTWFVRCDNQIGEIHGDQGYLFEAYRNFWGMLKRSDSEIAWHAHLYRKVEGRWIQETDESVLARNLKAAYNAMIRHGHRPVSARIGESYMSNGIMSTLDHLGIRMESTAMPGRIRKDNKFSIDWGTTPQNPYFPSLTDYRIPADNSLRILEVPMSMIPTKVGYDRAPLLRYVNLGFHHTVIRGGLQQYIRNNRLLVSITHPFEIIPSRVNPAEKHALLSHNPAEVSKNITYIIEEAKRQNKECIFIRLKDLLDEPVFSYIMPVR